MGGPAETCHKLRIGDAALKARMFRARHTLTDSLQPCAAPGTKRINDDQRGKRLQALSSPCLLIHFGLSVTVLPRDSTSKKDRGTWTVTNPKANPDLTSAQIRDLVVIAHYEVSWV